MCLTKRVDTSVQLNSWLVVSRPFLFNHVNVFGKLILLNNDPLKKQTIYQANVDYSDNVGLSWRRG